MLGAFLWQPRHLGVRIHNPTSYTEHGVRVMANEQSVLQVDYAVFEQHKAEWFPAHANEFVVVGDGAVLGFYADYEAALKAGLKGFGVNKQFLVKQVCLEEPVFVIY